MNTQPTWSDSPIHEQIRNMKTDTPETDAMVSADQHHLEDDNFFSAIVYWRICDLARRIERELTAVTEQRDKLIKAIEPLEYWRDISECDCSCPLPQGGCLRCDLNRILKLTKPKA